MIPILHDLDEIPAGKRLSHVFFGDIDYTESQSTSADQAGDGLVTIAEDLYRFRKSGQMRAPLL